MSDTECRHFQSFLLKLHVIRFCDDVLLLEGYFSMSRIFDELCSKPEIVLAFLSKSNYSMIIMSTKQFARTKRNIKVRSVNVRNNQHNMIESVHVSAIKVI